MRKIIKKIFAAFLVITLVVGNSAITGQAADSDAEYQSLLITELLQNSANNASAEDAYEFIEIYNNSDEAINLKGYQLTYTYSKLLGFSSSTDTWYTFTEDKYLSARECLVFWVWPSGNDSDTYTIDTFNSYYGTSLTETQLIKTTYDDVGMANTSKRSVSIKNSAGTTVDSVTYDGATTSRLEDEAVTYWKKYSNSTFSSVTTDLSAVPTPGTVPEQFSGLEDGQVVSGTQEVISYGTSLLISGRDVSSAADTSVNGDSEIIFTATKTDTYFKNAVSVGEDVIGIFNDGTYDTEKQYRYSVDAKYLNEGSKTITLEFHAGNKANVLEHNSENNDDFILKGIHLQLPNGKTLYPTKYQAKIATAGKDDLTGVSTTDYTLVSQTTEILMGDKTGDSSKYCEILYVTFTLADSDFDALRYDWDTTTVADGTHIVSNRMSKIWVTVDNTAPTITTNLVEGETYRNGTIEVTAIDARSEIVTTEITLDGIEIDVPYEFRALEMLSGEHVLKITSSDDMGNETEKTVTFKTSKESADIGEEIFPENGSVVTESPTLSVNVTDESNDEMTVTFKRGERYQLEDTNITSTQGDNGFPYEIFNIALEDTLNENTVVNVKWSGESNNAKTKMYVYNTTSSDWEKLSTRQTLDGADMTLQGDVVLKDHFVDGCIKIKVQNGEGYIPTQYAAGEAGENSNSNANDTPREDYDFTFVVESDTQYYNEDYEGNDAYVTWNGKYKHQLNIHNWVLNNRERMNIQYLFHDGDIIDDVYDTKQWQQADEAYKLLDNAGLPYGVLAGNHDVGHLEVDYTNYAKYFGENRYASNPWYGESYKNNRGHYDLITVGGIDFIMIYMGWEVGDAEIAWMNQVLAKYPERKAILNFHEYLLASGGLGEEPQHIYNDVVSQNENVCMVLSGHYHNAQTRVDTFENADGTTRKVYSMLFDYQNMSQGGYGYIRLMHFDLDGKKILVRTYSPSLNDYNAADGTISGANISGSEEFSISFADLGITPYTKTIQTTGLDVNVYTDEVIGQITGVESGSTASYLWSEVTNGIHGWYAEVTDSYGGLTRSSVRYVNVERANKIHYEPRSYEAGTVPTLDGFLFAGWYTGENESNPVKTPVDGSDYFAKFVPEEVLSIKAQISSKLLKGNTAEDTLGAIRFVTTIDSTSYKEIGFNIRKGTGTPSDAKVSNYVYQTLYAVDATAEEKGEAMTEYTPKLFHEESVYFKTWTIKNIKPSDFNKDVTIVPYWVTLDGTRVEGTSVIKTINLGRSWIYVDTAKNTDEISSGTLNHPFDNLNDAVAFATNLSDEAPQPKVILTKNMTLNTSIQITRSMELSNETDVTLTEGSSITGDLFAVQNGAAFTIKGAENTAFVVDGADTSAEAGSLVKVSKTSTFYMKNAKMTGAYSKTSGGAIYNSGTVTLLDGCVFENNKASNAAAIFNEGVLSDNGSTYYQNTATATSSGGAVRNQGGQATFTGSNFTENSTADDGGAIYSDVNATRLEMTNCKFDNNTAKNGGAIYINLTGITNAGNTFVGENCIFKNNSIIDTCSSGGGAALFTGTGVAELVNSVVDDDGVYDYEKAYFDSNTCNVDSRYGGAIYVNTNATLYVTGYNFNNNSARAGAAVHVLGTLVDRNSSFQSNVATKNAGGAIRNMGQATFTGSTFTGNKMADGVINDGGAVYSEGKKLDFEECLFDGNIADRGGAIYVNLTNINSNNGEFSAENCIFKNNSVTNTGWAGGALYLKGTGTARLTNGVKPNAQTYDFTKACFEGNVASSGGGGAVLVEPGITLHISGYRFYNNEGHNAGGALYNYAGTVYDTGCIYEDNISTTNAGAVRNYTYNGDGAYFEKTGGSFEENIASTYGGAIVNDIGSELIMNDGNFVGNRSNGTTGISGTSIGHGGGAICQRGIATLSKVNFEGNVSNNYGGALYVSDTNAITNLEECEFDGNLANYGGAVLTTKLGKTTTNVNGCTFENNCASSNGGAFYIWTYGIVNFKKSENGMVNSFQNNYSNGFNANGWQKKLDSAVTINGKSYENYSDIVTNAIGLYTIDTDAATFANTTKQGN